MAEPSPEGTPGPGTAGGHVEQEARQLVAAAARWLSAAPSAPQEYADRPDGGPKDARDARDATGATDSAGSPESERGSAHDRGSGPEPCTGCPWCRAKAAAGPLGADTLESLSQLLGAAAASLQLMAQSRRDQAAEGSSEGSSEDRSEDPTEDPSEDPDDTGAPGDPHETSQDGTR